MKQKPKIHHQSKKTINHRVYKDIRQDKEKC